MSEGSILGQSTACTCWAPAEALGRSVLGQQQPEVPPSSLSLGPQAPAFPWSWLMGVAAPEAGPGLGTGHGQCITGSCGPQDASLIQTHGCSSVYRVTNPWPCPVAEASVPLPLSPVLLWVTLVPRHSGTRLPATGPGTFWSSS